jgi:hypothetical protein
MCVISYAFWLAQKVAGFVVPKGLLGDVSFDVSDKAFPN